MPLVMVEPRISVGLLVQLGGQIRKDASQPHTLKRKLLSVFEQKAWRRETGSGQALCSQRLSSTRFRCTKSIVGNAVIVHVCPSLLPFLLLLLLY